MLKPIYIAPLLSTFGKYFNNHGRGQQLSAMKKWSIDKDRRTTKEKGSRSYKSRNSAKVNVKSLNDSFNLSMTVTVRKMETGAKKGICFLLIPGKIII